MKTNNKLTGDYGSLKIAVTLDCASWSSRHSQLLPSSVTATETA